jgi:flagellar hook protein FlgE
MSMFNIGLSGLKTTQKALEITSHNIANSGTAGFKSGSAEFASVYNGGQRGGVDVSDIKTNFAREGNVVNTGSALDLAITGKGFFVVAENGRMAYTQAGQFGLDKEQNIINSTGNRLQGYSIDAEGNLVPGILTDLKVEAQNIPAEATKNLDFALNLNAGSTKIPYPVAPADIADIQDNEAFDPKKGDSYNFSQSSEVFDSLGNSHTLTQYFNHVGENTWQVMYFVDGQPLEVDDPTAVPLTSSGVQVPFSAPATTGNIGLQWVKVDGAFVPAAVTTVTFAPDGQMLPLDPAFPEPVAPAEPDNNVLDPYNQREITLSFAAQGALPLNITLDMVKATQFGSGFSMYKNEADGYTSGEFAGVAVAETGEVFATFTNGATKLQGQVVLANFANNGGLEQGNGGVWYATNESGDALYGTPDAGSFGALLSGAYVGSNVDISEQLVDLMAFQQNYQANAKTISSADEMMQILFSAT